MEFLTSILPTPMALAAIALLGYIVGRRSRGNNNTAQLRRELKRAKAVINELERISREIRGSLANHHSSVVRFKNRLAEVSLAEEQRPTQELCKEAERLLKPTMQLAAKISSAYDEIRQQTNMLMSFTEVRTDPLTGLCNRRALDESLATLLAMKRRYQSSFAVAIFDIDHFKAINDELGHVHGDHVLQNVARHLEICARETDIVARYGGEEFVVILPETDALGAAILARRVRRVIEKDTHVTISGGIAVATDGDNEQTLLARADSALYAAKAAGRNRVFHHNGIDLEGIEGRNAISKQELALEDSADEDPPADEHAAVLAENAG